MSLEEDFKRAASESAGFKQSPDGKELRHIYGLFKQGNGADFATSNPSRPGPQKIMGVGVPDSMNKPLQKYLGWEEVKDLSVEEAQKQYIEFIEQLKVKYGFDASKVPA